MGQPAKLTRAQKEVLIKRLRDVKQANVKYLNSVIARAAADAERKVLKRLNKVAMTVRTVPIGAVLDYERSAKPTIAEIRKFARKG